MRKPFLLPEIGRVVQELPGLSYALALDLKMGYYTIRLDPDAQKICTLITPWGKYQYLRLPMGISCAPDIFQDRMSSLVSHLEFARVYIDNLLCILDGFFTDHLSKLEKLLEILQKAGLKCNAEEVFLLRRTSRMPRLLIDRGGNYTPTQ